MGVKPIALFILNTPNCCSFGVFVGILIATTIFLPNCKTANTCAKLQICSFAVLQFVENRLDWAFLFKRDWGMG